MVIPDKFNVTAEDAYNYIASKYFADQQLCMVLKFDGKIDEAILARAVRVTLDLEPVLGCRLAIDSGNLFWLRRSDLDELQTCQVIAVQQALQDFINTPTHADVDPLVATRLLREGGGDTVCVKVNHSACDGGGLKEYMSLLSSVYNSLVLDGKCLLEPNLAGRRDQTQVFQYTKDTKTVPLKDFPKPTWALPQKQGPERRHIYRTLPAGKLAAIKQVAKSKKATVNDALLAALYRQFFTVNNAPEGKPMIIQVSIDLRRYCPNRKAEAICNLSSGLHLELERKLGEGFEQTLERATAAMNKFKEKYPGIETAVKLDYLFSHGFAWMEKYMGQTAELSQKYSLTYPLLSNFGVLPDYSFGGLHAKEGYITPPIMYTPGFMLGASTFDGMLTLSIGYCGVENTAKMQSFLDSLIEDFTRQSRRRLDAGIPS
jgi:NRPS condensation-like uncharacterized protein